MGASFRPFAGDNDQGGPPRLTSAMSSRKLQALGVIRRYYLQWGHSPTLGELASALGISVKRAHDLVEQLARAAMIERVKGKARGIRLPDRSEELSEAEIVLRLQASGWTVGVGRTLVEPAVAVSFPIPVEPLPANPLTDQGLPPVPELDHEEDDRPGSSGEHVGGQS